MSYKQIMNEVYTDEEERVVYSDNRTKIVNKAFDFWAEVEHLTDAHPNDMELGGEIRKLVKRYNNG